MTSSQDEKYIYEGCISLLNEIAGEIRDYLEWQGFNMDDIPEEERLVIKKNPTEIVEALFLRHTAHGGGTSQRLKCKELGIDPDKSVEIDFSDSAE